MKKNIQIQKLQIFFYIYINSDCINEYVIFELILFLTNKNLHKCLNRESNLVKLSGIRINYSESGSDLVSYVLLVKTGADLVLLKIVEKNKRVLYVAF